jgi:TRAP transporter 4TM/12TM fusion protein
MRRLNQLWVHVVLVVSICFVIFHFWTAGFGLLSDLLQRSIHLGVALFLLFILKPATKKRINEKIPVYDMVLAVMSLLTCVYVLANYQSILRDPFHWVGGLDVFFAIILLLLVLEASRRAVGLTFVVLGLFFLMYAVLGRQMPGIWAHKGFSFDIIFQTLYHTTSGIYGSMVGTSATMLAMFGIFGAVLSSTGGAQTFITLGEKATGKTIGGPGKVTLIASGLFGMISGSAMANVVATGTFTIPLMKKVGYDKEWTAATTAVGATGGQIMPPVMGAGAFLMAQFLGVNYLNIAKAAIVPAVLYYLGAFVAVHFISLKFNIRGEKNTVKIKIHEYITIFVPLLIFLLFLSQRYSVMVAAFYATIGGVIICILVYFLQNQPASAAKKSVEMLHKTTNGSASGIVDAAALLAGAQVTITMISMTGFGVKLSNEIVSFGQENLFLCLVLSMVICIILGMGLPTTAAYVLAAAVMVPALIMLKMDPLMAHMFVFFFSCLATITPPVCSAVYMSAGIAEANWLKTGILAVWIALPAFIVPFTFAYNKSLLLIGSPMEIVVSVFTAIIGVIAMGIAVAGYIKKPLYVLVRILLIVSGILMIIPHVVISAVGLVLMIFLVLISRQNSISAGSGYKTKK